MKKALFILLAAVLLVAPGNPDAKGSKPGGKPPRKMVANSAPDFALKDLDGKTVALEQFIGDKIVIIEFWATWCGPCRMTMAAVHNVREKFRGRDVEVLSIDQGEDSTKVGSFVKAKNLKLWVLLDTDNEVSRSYGVTGIPTLFVIDKEGVVKARVVGFRPDLEAALTQFLEQLLAEPPPPAEK